VLSRLVSQSLVLCMARRSQEDLTLLRDLMEAGKITPVIDRSYRLSEVPQAVGYLGEGHARGKVVITLDEAQPTGSLQVRPAVT